MSILKWVPRRPRSQSGWDSLEAIVQEHNRTARAGEPLWRVARPSGEQSNFAAAWIRLRRLRDRAGEPLWRVARPSGEQSNFAAAWIRLRRLREGRDLRQARILLDLACFVLPRKITDECIGDSVELLEKAAKEGAHPWKLQAKALICVFWAAIFTLRELAKPAALLAALWRLLSGSLW